MRLFAVLVLSTVFSGAMAAAQQSSSSAAETPLELKQTLPLAPEIKGNFDHFGIDLKRNRLFATPEDFKALLVFDLAQGKLIHTIEGIMRPHAVLFREDTDRLYVTDGGDGSVKVYDGETYQQLERIPLLKDADSIGYDISKKYLYVDNGGRDVGQAYSMLSVIDTTSNKKIADIKIEGDTLEAMALDTYRPRLYVNDKAKNRVVVIDRVKNAGVATWPITGCKGNTTMALDEQHQRLFVGCRDGKLVVLDTNTGKELETLTITPGVDDTIYDAKTKRLYAVGGGAVDSFDQIAMDQYAAKGSVHAGPGARTGKVVPQLDELFVAVPHADAENAKVLVYTPMHAGAGIVRGPEPQEHVDAPRAEELILNFLSAHPMLRKTGLHVIPPGGKEMILIANGNATRLGIHTSPGDFAAVKSGKTYGPHIAGGGYYNMKMNMFDARERNIGILVMEIPDTSASSEEDAAHQAEALRKELASQIPSLEWLFQQK
jgi:DNA-binding beta-propeller fold protein YncE